MNTLGATWWTDGRIEGPMYADVDWLLKHPSTRELFWVDECEEVERDDIDAYDEGRDEDTSETPAKPAPQSDDNRVHIPVADSPDESDLRSALQDLTFVNTAEKERYLRTRLWWIANDPIRNGKANHPSDFELFHSNLGRLEVLLDSCEPEQRLISAEVARELENFSGAEELLRRDFPKELQASAEFLKKLVRSRDPLVRAFDL